MLAHTAAEAVAAVLDTNVMADIAGTAGTAVESYLAAALSVAVGDYRAAGSVAVA